MRLTDKANDFVKETLNTILDGSLDKKQLLAAFNSIFKEMYYSGSVKRLVTDTVCKGLPSFKHDMSVSTFRSGLLFEIQNDNQLKRIELQDISSIVLDFPSMIRLLKSLGFDTLVLKGKRTEGLYYKIEEGTTPTQNELQPVSTTVITKPTTARSANTTAFNPMPGKGVSQRVINFIANTIILAVICLIILLIRMCNS